MKSKAVEGIQPSVMRWARESIGLELGEVARRLKRQIAEIEAWESGEAAPTYPQLEKLAYDIYKRPLAVFFLPEPPAEQSHRTEFRSLPLVELDALLPDTHLHIRKAHAYQLALAELWSDNPANRHIWQEVNLQPGQPLARQAEQVRRALGIDMALQASWRQPDTALKQWRSIIEDRGIFVFKHSFKQRDISGFCLAHPVFPVIYLNNSTTKTRQLFSLLHELCHLLLEQNGISKFEPDYIQQLPPAQQRIESLCNALVAEILIPSGDFAANSNHLPQDIEQVSDTEIEQLANRYSVSREAILRRFLDQHRVSPAYYQRKAEAWAAQQKKSEGGTWFGNINSYLSPRFAQEVVSQHYRNQLSMEQASELLGIKAKNFEGLEQRILRGAMA